MDVHGRALRGAFICPGPVLASLGQRPAAEGLSGGGAGLLPFAQLGPPDTEEVEQAENMA